MFSSSLVYLFSFAAAANGLLALLVSMGWRGDVRGGLFAAALWSGVLWSIGLIFIDLEAPWAARSLPLTESLRICIWVLFIGSLQVSNPRRLIAQLWEKPSGRMLSVVWVISLLFSVAMVLASIQASPLWATLLLLLIVAGLVGLENLYRRANTETRWRLKFLVFGIGGLLVFDFILYADFLLFRVQNNPLWAARGIVNTVMVPLLAVAAARNRSWSIDIQISRQVVFQSSIGLISGLYLLGLALGGYYIRYTGGAWGEVAQIVVLFMGSVFFITLLASKQFRSRVRVFVSKHFFSYQFDYREQWLKFTQLLASNTADKTIEACALEAIAQLVESPRGQLWLRHGTRYELATHRNMPAPVQALEANSSMVQALDQKGWVIDLEARDAGDFNPMIPEWLRQQTGARLVVPLLWQSELTGFVVLSEPHGGLQTNWEVHDLLKVAGRQAASYLAQARVAKELLVARQFESFNKMSAFIVHDLKNLVSQLDLISTNAPRLIERPDFQKDLLDTVANSVERMKRLLDQLQDARMPSEQAVVVDAYEVCTRAVASFKSAPVPPVLEANGSAAQEVVANPEKLERVIRHLLANAQDAVLSRQELQNGTHTTMRCPIRLKCADHSADQIVLQVEDDGIGMTPEFLRSKLFQPFESTKSRGTGLGMYESREYIRTLGGDVEVMSTAGQGTTVKIFLRRHRPVGIQ
ncbi:MAG: PEP-CTERM system histidine kinase PrsK [Burkholderiaceae bacterium]|nr:MAG: PEP-CTERM system histidine kinase PrsK [Burkholderiaceae bacterium]